MRAAICKPETYIPRPLRVKIRIVCGCVWICIRFTVDEVRRVADWSTDKWNYSRMDQKRQLCKNFVNEFKHIIKIGNVYVCNRVYAAYCTAKITDAVCTELGKLRTQKIQFIKMLLSVTRFFYKFLLLIVSLTENLSVDGRQ